MLTISHLVQVKRQRDPGPAVKHQIDPEENPDRPQAQDRPLRQDENPQHEGEELVEIRVAQPVRVLGLRLQLHQVDDVDHSDFLVGQMLAHRFPYRFNSIPGLCPLARQDRCQSGVEG